MPRIPVNGVELHVEDKGSGTPIVFVHEFAGDHRSWEPQVSELSQRYRCIAYGARGYPPSDVPEREEDYGWQTNVDDLAALLDALDIDRAFIVGLSMGAYVGLTLAMQRPERLIGLVAASGGSGAYPPGREKFLRDCLALADRMLEADTVDVNDYALGPARVQLLNKNPDAFEIFSRNYAEHPAIGSAYTQRRVQAARPSLYDLEDELRGVRVPTLLVVGDEDELCLDVNLYLKRVMPWSGLVVLPKSGHCVNLEEPEVFNRLLEKFLVTVEEGRWESRDRRATLAAP